MTEPLRVEICLSGPGGACTKAEVKPNNYPPPNDRGNTNGLIVNKTSLNPKPPNNKPETEAEKNPQITDRKQVPDYLDQVTPDQIPSEGKRLFEQLQATDPMDYERTGALKDALWGLAGKAREAGIDASTIPELTLLPNIMGAQVTVGLNAGFQGLKYGGRKPGTVRKLPEPEPAPTPPPSEPTAGGYVNQKSPEMMNPRALRSRQGPSEMSKSKVNRLAKDMKENGYDPNYPIEAADADGKTIILDGHHRAEAAIKSGIEKVPVNINQVSSDEAAILRAQSQDAAAERLNRR